MMAFLIENMAPLMFVALVVVLLIGYPVAFALAAVGIGFGHPRHRAETARHQPAAGVAGAGVGRDVERHAARRAVFHVHGADSSNEAAWPRTCSTRSASCSARFAAVLAYAVIFVGALLAATTGVVAASVISMGLISLPIMLRYGYDRRLASGVIAASGTLAQIIPPSLVLIIMADQLGRSVGDLYAGAFIPGLTLAGLYAIYVIGCSIMRPNWAPALPLEARTLREPDGSSGNRSLLVLTIISCAAAAAYWIIYYDKYNPDVATDERIVLTMSVGVASRSSWPSSTSCCACACCRRSPSASPSC
jgi:TRAP-type mannitol/chloroaromatic compound transport system permease large subunit